MAGHGNEDLKPEALAHKAADAGSDFSQGSQKAYDAMMQVVNDAQTKLASNPANLDKFNKALVDDLSKRGSLEELSENYAVRNLDRVAHSDNGKARFADFKPEYGQTALEQQFLTSLRNNFGELQERAGTRTFGGAKVEFGENEFRKVLDSRQHERDVAEQQRLAQEAQQREQAKLQETATALFAHNGNPKTSLYSVLDGIKSNSGKNDGDISRGDLESYVKKYQDESDRGNPNFTPEKLATVNTLLNEWDKPLGHALRGERGYSGGRDGSHQKEYSAYINMEAAGEALGLNGKNDGRDIYAAYAPVDGRRSTMSQVDGDGTTVQGARPLPRSADGTATTADSTAGNTTGQRFDANGNVVGDSTAATSGGADLASGTPRRRALGPDGRPLDAPAGNAGTVRDGSGNVVRDGSGNPVRTGTANPDAGGYDQYYGPNGDAAASGRTNTTAGDGQRQQRRATAAGDAAATAPAATGDTRAASTPRPGALPDLDHAPELKMPEFKAGDDMTKVAADFQKAALDHFTASAIYTVKPGQGWDRIARDTMRKSGEDIAERNVVAMSDAVAKMNGMSGRLDGSKVLHPGDQVRVRDDAWIKAQVEAAMAQFQQKVTDATKTGATTAPEAATGPDLYNGARNGEGDVTAAPTAQTTGDAAAAGRTTTAPANGDAAAAGATTTAPANGDAAAAGRTTTAPTTGDASTLTTPAAPGAVDSTAAGAGTLTPEQQAAADAEKKRREGQTGSTATTVETPDIYGP